MLAITLGGQMGAGCPEVGVPLARGIGGNYVELSALRRTTRKLGATVDAVARKELAFGSKRTRLGHLVELWFSNMGRYPVDPSMDGSFWVDPQPLVDLDRKTLPAQISNHEYREAIFETAAEYAHVPNIVLGRRAGVVALREVPGVVHVGLFAPLDARIARTCNRLGIGPGEALEVLSSLESARAGWFDHLGDAHPHDKSLYDFTVDSSEFSDEAAVTRRIRDTAYEIRYGSAVYGTMSDGHHDVM